MCQFVWESPLVSWDTSATTIALAPLSLFLIFALDDLIYAPTHRFMHWGPVYWIIHKHHHKQKFPVRGYFDAANETPIEQLLGLRGLKFDHNCHLLAEVRRLVTDVLVGVPTDTST